MTEPALYFWKQAGQWLRTGHNIGGYEIDQVLALGPQVTRRYLEALRHQDDEDIAWWAQVANGGARVDADMRQLTVFTDLVGFGVEHGQRAAFLDVLTRSWPGWTVRWAYGGVADIADDPGLVCHDPPVLAEVTKLPDLSRSGGAVVTVAGHDDGVLAYQVDTWEHGEPWLVGPRLLELLRADQRCTTVRQIPACGMHVDIAQSAVGLWTTWCWPGLAGAWPQLWPGWSLALWDDRHAEQSARSAGAFAFPELDLAAELARYGDRLDDLWLRSMQRRRGYADEESGSDFVELSREEYHRLRNIALG